MVKIEQQVVIETDITTSESIQGFEIKFNNGLVELWTEDELRIKFSESELAKAILLWGMVGEGNASVKVNRSPILETAFETYYPKDLLGDGLFD